MGAKFTHVFYGTQEVELAALKSWADSLELPCVASNLVEPLFHKGRGYTCTLTIGPIDVGMYDTIDDAEKTFCFEMGNEGSFKTELREEEGAEADAPNGRFAENRAAA